MRDSPTTATVAPCPPRRAEKHVVQVPLNRTEGDLEIRVELADGHVVDAWSAGTMYRGIENILVGRGPLDGLVITPRVCGICSTAHLAAAAQALDAITGLAPPPDAVRIRNLALMTELLQSDVRQSVLMYMVDFASPVYADVPLHAEAVRRYAPFSGSTVLDVIRHSKQVVEIIALIGGQWPHSSYMVPGGVVTVPNPADLLQCRHLLGAFRAWYEQRFLGCALERWLAVRSAADLDAWLIEDVAHRDGEVGFFLRFARHIGLDRVGRGHGRFLSVGGLDIPSGSLARSRARDATQLIPAGVMNNLRVQPFQQQRVSEDIAHAWYEGEPGGVHPFAGETRPYASGNEQGKYTWAKAPRYDGQPAETGPLAESLIAGHPLFLDLVQRDGPNALVRELARLVRPAELIGPMECWLNEITPGGSYYTPAPEIIDGQGCGLTEAARGALGHWVRIADGRIQHYQIITPTAWNGSPRDTHGVRGPWEEALLGTPVRDPENPIELGHVVRSFDPCLVCTVHAVRGPRTVGRTRV